MPYRSRQNQPQHTRQRYGPVDDDWLADYNAGRHLIEVLAERRPYETIKQERQWSRKHMLALRSLADLRWIKKKLWETQGIDPPIEDLPQDEWLE
jgi:hypothetical protein